MSQQRIFVDLSQFVSQPAHSGIQRVLTKLVCNWPRSILDADIGYLGEDKYHLVSVEGAAKIMRTHFAERRAPAAEIHPQFAEATIDKIKASELSRRYSAYCLPEPTYRSEILDVLHQQSKLRKKSVFALLFDALPQTAPQVFASSHQLITSRYFRLMASLDNVACISQSTLTCLERRLRRSPIPNGKVVCLGADSFSPSPHQRMHHPPTFVAVGTVEPRKNHRAILAAFKELWRRGNDYRLILIGAPGWHSPSFLTELQELMAADPKRFTWHQRASDEIVQVALSEATGAIFVSELEGHGLPAIEALAAGCPLITSTSIPALDGLPPSGQIRLSDVTPAAIAAALHRLADTTFNRQMRAELTALSFTTWRDFALGLVGWIRETLNNSMSGADDRSGGHAQQ